MNSTRDRKVVPNGCMDLTLSQVMLEWFHTPLHVFIMELYPPAHSRAKGKHNVSALLFELSGLLLTFKEENLLIMCKSFSRSNNEMPQACKHFLASLSCSSCCNTGSVLVANIRTTKPSCKKYKNPLYTVQEIN